MEMKLYKSTSTLLLVTLLLVGCGGNENQSANQTETSIANSSQNNISEQSLKSFQAAIDKLKENLKDKDKEISLSSYKIQYKKVESIIEKSDLSNDDRSILKDLNGSNDFNPKETKPSKEIKTLQKKLDPSGSTDGLYGVELGNKLSERLGQIDISSVSSISDRNTNSAISQPPSGNPAPGNPNSSQWLIIPTIVAAILSILSLGTSAFIYSLLKRSNARLEKLEKKTKDNKDELRKWATNVDKNIKTLSSQQSEIDRKFQQQRQAAKSVGYPNSPQSYGGREQVEYGEIFNSPSAQNPYVSSERQPYSGSAPAQSSYQAPQSPNEMIAQQFNTNPSSIATSAQGVSETEDSIYRRRRDSSIKQVTLQTISNYSYWIIPDAEGGYWLTPIAELKLNPMNFDTFQALFQFNGEPLSGKLQLTKPAKVTQASTGQWELIDRGEVQFV
jgi:hypothetical protein